MWRNLKFLQQWHVCDVEIVKFMLFCCKIGFIAIYALLSRNLFCRNLRTFVWRKIEPKIASVEKKWQISGMCIRGFKLKKPLPRLKSKANLSHFVTRLKQKKSNSALSWLRSCILRWFPCDLVSETNLGLKVTVGDSKGVLVGFFCEVHPTIP